jgi:predicted metal-dependent peptidase
MPVDLQAIETKLTAARTKLILDKPFLGALVLRLPMVAANKDWCPTTATDARKFYYNAEYIDDLSMAQTQFMLAHEALHCALSHFARRQHRVKHRWDLACDYAINPLLIEDGLVPPPNANIIDLYKGMTAEEIYPLIEDNPDNETLDQHVYDKESEGGGTNSNPPPEQKQQQKPQEKKPEPSEPEQEPSDGQGKQEPDEQQQDQGQGEGQQPQQQSQPQPAPTEEGDDGAELPPPLTPDERETLEVQWQQRMAGAAQQAMQAGKLGGTLARMIDHLLQPQLPWRMLLARYMTAMARDDFSYMRPSRREGEGNAILPSLRSNQVEVVVAVDTSGSIKAGEIEEFISEINAIKGQMRARVTLIPCDSDIVEGAPWFYEPWEEFDFPDSVHGGGGTDFRPVFDWLGGQGLRPELLVYFTDAQGRFPEHEPNFDVIWLVKGKETVPWGQRIQLN